MRMPYSPDRLVTEDEWSDLRRWRQPPAIDFECLYDYRLARLREQLRLHDAAFCILLNPVSLRYAVDYRGYALFQSHIPTTYLFLPQEGPVVLFNSYGEAQRVDARRKGRHQAFFDGGTEIDAAARALAGDVVDFLVEIGSDNRRVAIEYVNPSITRALGERGIEVIDGVRVSELARVIKSAEEIDCMRWAIAVAEHGIAALQRALRPGVREIQLWALLNYTNLANDGNWHEGRMLASGPRINPWLQEASDRQVEAGDLVGVDTDMVGPFGYFADISRTLFCGPGRPSARQKALYRLAVDEIEHNRALLRPGITLLEFQRLAYQPAEEFRANAYTCVMHAVGMCDEYPQVKYGFRETNPCDCTIEAGMVLCLESYMGAVGERDGVKLEQQLLVTETGSELLTGYPYDENLMD